MKTPKSARKLLRRPCPSCGTVQDSLNAVCKSCDAHFFVQADHERLVEVRAMLDELDEAMAEVSNPSLQKGNPYTPVDKSFKLIRELRRYDHVPGLAEYLQRHRQKLLPFKVRLLQNTVKANTIFLVLLLLFPVLPLALGWPPMIPLLMVLPAIVWGLVTWKAWMDLRKAREDMEKT